MEGAQETPHVMALGASWCAGWCLSQAQAVLTKGWVQAQDVAPHLWEKAGPRGLSGPCQTMGQQGRIRCCFLILGLLKGTISGQAPSGQCSSAPLGLGMVPEPQQGRGSPQALWSTCEERQPY